MALDGLRVPDSILDTMAASGPLRVEMVTAARSRRARAYSFVLGFIKFVGYAVVTLVPASAAIYTLQYTLPGLSSNSQNVALPSSRLGPPTASSYRQDRDKTSHSPTNLLDDDPKTFWSECKASNDKRTINDGSTRRSADDCLKPSRRRREVSPGKFSGPSPKANEWVAGESVTLPLTEPTSLKGISVRNGDQYSPREYYRNPRARHLLVQLWTCSNVPWWHFPLKWQTFTCDHPNSGDANLCFVQYLPDEQGYQTFGAPLFDEASQSNVQCSAVAPKLKASGGLPPPGRTLFGVTQVRLTVVDAYDGEDQLPDADPLTGSNGASTDLIISDVRFIPDRLPR